MTGQNVGKQGWVSLLFSPDSNDRLSLNFHRFVILYISCDTRSVGLGQYCLPKVYNGFKVCLLPGYHPGNHAWVLELQQRKPQLLGLLHNNNCWHPSK